MRENEQSNIIEKGISINEMALTIYRQKWVIILATLFSALVMYFTSAYIMPKKYQSVVVVAIIQPDTEGSDIALRIPKVKELVSLAQSSEIFSVVSDYGGSVDGIALAKGDDEIQFVVTALSPDLAADLANTWVAEFSDYIEENYSIGRVVEDLEIQQANLKQLYIEANKELETATLESQLFLIEAEREDVKHEYNYSQSQNRRLGETIEAAQSLESQLVLQNQETILTSYQWFYILALYLRDTSGGKLTNSSDLFPEKYSTKQALQDLSEFLEVLRIQQQILESQIENLADDLISYHTHVWQLQSDLRPYTQKRDKASSNYVNVSLRLAEAQRILSDYESLVKIVRQAEASSEPTSPNLLISTVIAGVVGLTFSTGFVFILEMWRSNDE